MFTNTSIRLCLRTAATCLKFTSSPATNIQLIKPNPTYFKRFSTTINTVCLRPSTCSNILIQSRSFSNDDHKLKNEKRVYYGFLTPRVKAVKVFSITTSVVGLCAQPLFMEQGIKLGGMGMAVFLCSFVGFFTFVTPLLLHFITKKYITEIHYDVNKDEYVATTISLLLYKIKTKFQISDVKVPEIPGMFTSFLIRGKPFFVDPSQFDDPEHYVRIMGYDKPIDFKLGSKDDNELKNEEKTK